MPLLSEPWRLFFLLAGPFVGTLAATWAVAWPRLPRPLAGASVCARCGAVIPPARQIPIVSWVLSRGGRLCCDGRIPHAYPLGETAGLAVGLACALFTATPAEAALKLLLGAALIYAALVDLRRFVIPAQAIALVAALGLAEHLRRVDLPALMDGVIGAVGVAAVFETLRRVSALGGGKPRMGAGDGLLAAALALWIGWQGVPLLVAAAALGALLVLAFRRRRGVVSFGLWLSAAGGAAVVGVLPGG